MPKVSVVVRGKKECKKCLLWKALEEFSVQKRNTTGRYSYCKKCVSAIYKEKYLWRDYTPQRRAAQNNNRRKRLDHYRKKCREWDALHRDRRRAASRERYLRDPQKEKDRARRSREKYRLNHLARWSVGSAMKQGKLKKLPCCDCGSVDRISAHHHNGYEKDHWLDVVWLCSECHGKRHRSNGS